MRYLAIVALVLWVASTVASVNDGIPARKWDQRNSTEKVAIILGAPGLLLLLFVAIATAIAL